MGVFAKLNYDNFIINGEVNERLPLYNENIYEMIPLDGTNNSIFPTYKIESANITRGDSSILLSKSNIAITDNIMKFTGDNDSYIQLSSDAMDSKKIEIEFYFRINNLSSDSTLFSSEDLTIKIDSNNKYIYALMPNLTGKHTPSPDLSNGGFRLTKNNSIILNKMYRLKIIKYESIIRFLFESDRVKSMVCENGFNPTISFIGKEFSGEIKEINITHVNDNFSEKTILSLPSTYSLMFTLNLKSIEDKLLLDMGNLTISQEGNNINIVNNYLNGNYTNTFTANLNKDYLLFLIFENNEINLIVNDRELGYDIINHTFSCDINNYISIELNEFKDIIIYKIPLSKNIISNICKKRFTLNKDGNILYEIDETKGHEKLKLFAGNKYHFQLTRDLNSDCNTIQHDANVDFVNGGVKSSSDYKKIKFFFSDTIGLANTWDIIYKKKITSLRDNKHYDSLGNGLYWGIENNKFVLSYNNNTSYIDSLNINDLLDEWILISLTYSSNIIKLLIATSKGLFSTSISENISSTKNEHDLYDLFLGGRRDEGLKYEIIYGQAIYRDLTIVNGWNIDDIYKEKYFRTKFSYYENKLISNVNIVEETIN